jgi:VWFA-related protein
MSRRTPLFILSTVALLAAAGRAQDTGTRDKGTQEPALAFPTEIEQVTVDVVVVDKKGQPVTDLTRDDVEVYENGVRQTITSFDRFEVAPPAAPVPPATEEAEAPPAPLPSPPLPVSTNTDEHEGQGRTFVVVFDDVHLTPYTAQQARAAFGEFLRNEAREGDRVTLVVPGSGQWWSTRMEAGRDELLQMVRKVEALDVPETRRDYISDYEAMRIELFHDNQILNRVQRRWETYALPTMTEQSQHVRDMMATEDPLVTSRAAEVYYRASTRVRVTLAAMERALKALQTLKGRKSLVIVSNGFIYDTHLDGFKKVVDASRRANTAIYFVNSRGLEGLPVGMDADMSTILPGEDLGFAFAQDAEMTEGSSSLAADTGGFTVRNSNDLAGGLKRIADETRSYYLVGYSPTNTSRDGAFRKIEVKVPGRKGLEIRARRGYYAPTSEMAEKEEPGVDPVFQGAIDSPYDMDGLPLRMTDYVREETLFGKARVYVAAEVDIRPVRFHEEEGREVGALQFLLVTIQRETGEFFRFDQKLDLRLEPETRDRLDRTWLPIVREFELSPGRYRAKIVVQDKGSGRLGTVSHLFEVPDMHRFRLSTPVLSDLRETATDGTLGQNLALLARRDFAEGEPLYCQLDVFGAAKLEDNGMPRVSLGYEVHRPGGGLLTAEAPNLVNPTADGRVSRMIGFSLAGAEPGEYVLVLKVKDELTGRVLEKREGFRVTARAATPAAASSAAPPPGK